jgi:hypothetical protein
MEGEAGNQKMLYSDTWAITIPRYSYASNQFYKMKLLFVINKYIP